MHPPVALLLHPAARIAFSEFTVHPSTVIGLAALAALYWHFVDVVWIAIFTLVYLIK